MQSIQDEHIYSDVKDSSESKLKKFKINKLNKLKIKNNFRKLFTDFKESRNKHSTTANSSALMFILNENYSDVLKEWTKFHGKTFGYYEGHFPVIVSSDLEFLQEVFIKQSSNFSARRKIFVSRDEDAPDHALFTASRNRWKKMRNIMNPTFSSAKLRELGPLLILCADRLKHVLENENEKEVNITQFFKRFTMDSIWNCAFGVDIDFQNNPENIYFKKCESLFEFLSKPNILSFIGNYFHEFLDPFMEVILFLEKFLSNFIDFTRINPILWFMNHVFEIVEIRKKGNIVKKDYLQLLINCQTLTTIEVKLNLALFMIAGYETTSIALTYACYCLAKYQGEQAKVYEAIRQHFDSEEEINSDSIQEVEYLDMFVKEVLRYYPTGTSIISRKCTKSTNVRGIDIPEGLVIAVDALSLHEDVDLWGPVDPKEFYPLRHAVKRNPLAFWSFGNGPRNCIGMKFAFLELKIALSKMLINFEILPLKDMNEELELFEAFVRRPKHDVNVTLRKR
uniref:Cytochrome P450 n=1 Tax=Brachionus plicatilis TaxID=10195 RepID=A0A1X9RU74_BRAPC|nr:cytochrome P450 [Brachionus plicatilis]